MVKNNQTHTITRHHEGEQVESRETEIDFQQYWN